MADGVAERLFTERYRKSVWILASLALALLFLVWTGL